MLANTKVENLTKHFKIFALLFIVFCTELAFVGGFLPIKASMDHTTLVHFSGYFELIILGLTLINYGVYVMKFIRLSNQKSVVINVCFIMFTIINYIVGKFFVMSMMIAILY